PRSASAPRSTRRPTSPTRTGGSSTGCRAPSSGPTLPFSSGSSSSSIRETVDGRRQSEFLLVFRLPSSVFRLSSVPHEPPEKNDQRGGDPEARPVEDEREVEAQRASYGRAGAVPGRGRRGSAAA